MHTFHVGQEVKFTQDYHNTFEYDGRIFIVSKIADIPLTNNDPFSSDYMGEQEGQNATGHPQSVKLTYNDGVDEKLDHWISGVWIEPA